jgi:hypothetical protein
MVSYRGRGSEDFRESQRVILMITEASKVILKGELFALTSCPSCRQSGALAVYLANNFTLRLLREREEGQPQEAGGFFKLSDGSRVAMALRRA